MAADLTTRIALETERERLLEEALERADCDPLTGLLNHRAFHRRFKEEEQRARRMSLTRSTGGFSMLDALVAAVDNKDRYTRRHAEDVLTYCLQIAQELGLDEKTRHTVAVAALLHDVGKIGVPDAVLRKPGKLSEEEIETIKRTAAAQRRISGSNGTA